MKRQLGLGALALLLAAVLAPAEASAGSGHHGHGGHHGHHRSYFSIGFGYPSFFYGSYYHRPYYYGGYGYYGYGYYGPSPYGPYEGYRGYPARGENALGGIDINVKPKKTQVYIDGDYAGLVRSYDGYPGYLWLPKGSYQLILYNPGYQTIEQNITVYPGVVIDFKTQMVPGESTPPQELSAPDPPARRPGRGKRPARLERDAARVGIDVAEAEVEVRDIPGEPGRLQLAVLPGDASVYLDGRFLGRGKEIGEIHKGLVIEPGEHLLEVVRPGREPETLAFRAGSGETVELEVTLGHEKG